MDRDYYADASAILSKLAVPAVECERADLELFSRSLLEAEIASILRKAEIGRTK